MLVSFLQSNRSLFNALANTWLGSGSTTFAVWSKGRQLVCWPPSAVADEPYLSAEIIVGGKGIGELRMSGDFESTALSRLKMDAALLADLISRENDLSAMTSELISTRDQLVALYNLTRNAGASIDLEQVIKRLALATAQLTRSETSFLAVRLSGAPFLSAFWPQPSFDPAELLSFIEDRIKNGGHEYYFFEGKMLQWGNDRLNLLILPIKIRGAEIAVIGVQTRVGYTTLSPLIKLIQTITEYASSNIENMLMVRESVELARLNTEMDLAKRVQMSLLPLKTPVCPGLDIWAASKPASVVGGDFYDFIEKPGRPLTFTVGDISGKGLPASLPMAMVRTLIRAHTNEFPPLTPDMILCASNAELYEDFDQLGMFSTAFVGQYHRSESTLFYSNAGHSPVIYASRKGGASVLQADGIPLGMLPTSFYENQSLCLEVGDVLIVGTDGLYEAHNAQNRMFGFERFVYMVGSLSEKTAEDIALCLMDTVEAYRGTETQEDDQTLIVIKRTEY